MSEFKDKEVFTLRAYYFVYIETFLVFICVIMLPIVFYNTFVEFCVPSRNLVINTCHVTFGESIYLISIFFIVSLLLITGRFVKPWDPLLIIDQTEIRHNRLPFFIGNKLIDKLFWRTFPLSSVGAIHLVIREQDKGKPGFKFEGNEADWKRFYDGLSFDEYMYYVGSNGRGPDYYDIQPLYKNQSLELFTPTGTFLGKLNISFIYEEDLKNLNSFLEKKRIVFKIRYADMPDTIKDILGPNA